MPPFPDGGRRWLWPATNGDPCGRAAWLVETVAVRAAGSTESSPRHLCGFALGCRSTTGPRAEPRSTLPEKISGDQIPEMLIAVAEQRCTRESDQSSTQQAPGPERPSEYRGGRQNSTCALALAGRATARRYTMPPSSNASKERFAARSKVTRRSISRRNQINPLPETLPQSPVPQGTA